MSTDALDKYCYIAPLKQALLAKFLSEFGLTNVQYSNNQFVHHKDRASFRTFHNLNFVKYSESLKELLEIPLQDTDSVFNVMTASVLDPSKDVLNIKEVGEVMYTEFLEKRRTGTDVSVWDTMHKRKLLTFKTSARVIEMKLKSDKILTLKAERSLMTKLLVITRSRPEIDVAELFSIHEFSAVPRSLFDQYGVPLRYTDQSSFLRGLKELTQTNTRDDFHNWCTLLDCMGFVNQMKLTSSTPTIDHFALQFCERIERLTDHSVQALSA